MKLNSYFQILHDDGLFPLTPALSLVERENRSQLFGKAMADSCAAAYAFYKNFQRLSPLPGGEGQGEGKASTITASRLVQRAILKTH